MENLASNFVAVVFLCSVYGRIGWRQFQQQIRFIVQQLWGGQLQEQTMALAGDDRQRCAVSLCARRVNPPRRNPPPPVLTSQSNPSIHNTTVSSWSLG